MNRLRKMAAVSSTRQFLCVLLASITPSTSSPYQKKDILTLYFGFASRAAAGTRQGGFGRIRSYRTAVVFTTILGAIALLLVPSKLRAIDFTKAAIVMFERNVMTLPEGLFQCSLDSASVSLSPIEATLAENGVIAIASLVPGFEPSDTTATTRLGDQCRITDWSRAFLIEAPSESSLDSLIADLQGMEGVIYAEPALGEVEAADAPYAFPSPCLNDVVFAAGDQWQFHNIGLNVGGQLDPGTADADIDLVEAWEITQGDSIMIAVFDYSIWRDHDDLEGKVFGDPFFDDSYQGHGTAVAGLIAAKSNNGVAISGVNPNATIYAKRVITPKLFAAVAAGVKEVINEGIPIINMSYSTSEDPTNHLAMRDAYNAGVLLVATVRYDHTRPGFFYPGRYDRVLAVGYTDANDEVPALQDSTSWIDLVAPGESVASIGIFEQDWIVDGGTSLAAPLVSGVASLLLSVRSDLNNDDLREIIVRSVDDVQGLGQWSSEYGYGRLNAQKALEMILFPNELYHGATAFNNYVESTTFLQEMQFVVGKVVSSPRPATRYEVRHDVTFPVTYATIPDVWGRGASTNGFDTENPNFGWQFCEVVGGSVTTSGCTLRTYVYEVGEDDWVPCSPEEVRFAYTVVGRGDHHYRIQSFVRKFGTSGLLSMPDNWAVGCPAGDADTIIVHVALDAADFEEAPPREDFTLSEPHNAKASLFPDCSTLVADHDAVLSTDPEFPNGCYKTSFRIASFGGFCGVDSLRVRFRGGLLGYVPINVRSPDMVSEPSSRARVSLVDFEKFATYYSSPPKAYEPLADFVAPTNVGIGDFSLFVYHYPSGVGHQYTPPSLLAGDGDPVVQGNAVVEISDGVPVGGQRTLLASVRLESAAPYRAALFAFRCNNPRLEFVGWEEASVYGGETIGAQATVGFDRVLAIGLLGNKNITGSSAIGVATFRVLGADSLILDEEDFAPVISDILLLSGAEGAMSASRIYGPVVGFTNSLKQNFPNPFNPETTLIYSIKDAGQVTLVIYDVAGRRVRELVAGHRAAGVYRAVWDGTDARGQRVASGVYFCKLTAGSFVATRKMVMLR